MLPRRFYSGATACQPDISPIGCCPTEELRPSGPGALVIPVSRAICAQSLALPSRTNVSKSCASISKSDPSGVASQSL